MKRETIVSIAESYAGRKEANGTHRPIIDLYNTIAPLPRGYKVTYTDAWCATYVSAVFFKAKFTDFPYECSCDYMIKGFKSRGQWQENDAYTPKAGDVIFYDWQDSGAGDNVGGSDHVGIVCSVSNGTMRIIEGNISNSVDYRNLKVNARYIRGFGLPSYDGTEEMNEPVKSETTVSEEETYTVKYGDSLWSIAANLLGDGSRYGEIIELNNLKNDLIRVGQVLIIKATTKAPETAVSNSMAYCNVALPLLKKGNTGLSVRSLQTLLKLRGLSVEVDGDFGADTESKVKSFQTAAKITVDGKVGSNTWKALVG